MTLRNENIAKDVLELQKYYEKNIHDIVLEFVNDLRKEVPDLEVQRFKTRVATRLIFLEKLNKIINDNFIL